MRQSPSDHASHRTMVQSKDSERQNVSERKVKNDKTNPFATAAQQLHFSGRHC
jgi:hypothetical protein